MSARLVVEQTGPLALVEDLGRPGLAAIGVGSSGAADRGALRLANRLVGNPEGHAAVEVTLGGLAVTVRGGPVWVAVTGAPVPLQVDGRPAGESGALALTDGATLTLGTPAAGLRSYVAVRGGVDVAEVLGSRSHDVLSGIGPSPLEPGVVLTVGGPAGDLPAEAVVVPGATGGSVDLRVVRGPRDDWIEDADELVTTAWTASDRSNRVGMRLDGGRLRHRRDVGELPSEGALRGAIQVPPSGEPVVFLADHPLTGGYPVVGVLMDEDTDRAAQVRPGQQVRLRWS